MSGASPADRWIESSSRPAVGLISRTSARRRLTRTLWRENFFSHRQVFAGALMCAGVVEKIGPLLWLKEQPNGRGFLGDDIKWNFTKFLIKREGQVMKRYGPMDDPSVVEKDLYLHL